MKDERETKEKLLQSARAEFLAKGGRALPAIGQHFYETLPLGFDPRNKYLELKELRDRIRRKLGPQDDLGRILQETVDQYMVVIEMLRQRGQPDFQRYSQLLYGSASDHLRGDRKTLKELGARLCDIFSLPGARHLVRPYPKEFEGEAAVAKLQGKLSNYFSDGTVQVKLSDGIVSDAAAGGDYIKLSAHARFSELDLQVLEVHEGWVHVGTTLNGQNQPICTFLSKGPPSSTVTQEGLAILMEIITFASYPSRLRKLTNRTRAIHMVEEGADFLQVFEFFREQGFEMAESYGNASRVFRGSVPTGLPFTKDLSYLKGFIMVYNYIQLAVRKGKLEQVPLLFCGKTTLEDMRTLRQLVDEGLVVPPKYLPEQFRDMNALAAWMCFSNFLNHLSLDRIEADYSNIL